MSEDFSRVEQLQFLVRVREQDLVRARDWLAAEERRLAELAARRPPPPPPAFVVEQGIGVGRRTVAVHQGWCTMAGSRTKAIPRDQVLRLLAEDGRLACQQCRPDTELGVL